MWISSTFTLHYSSSIHAPSWLFNTVLPSQSTFPTHSQFIAVNPLWCNKTLIYSRQCTRKDVANTKHVTVWKRKLKSKGIQRLFLSCSFINQLRQGTRLALIDSRCCEFIFNFKLMMPRLSFEGKTWPCLKRLLKCPMVLKGWLSLKSSVKWDIK